jgi:hypothetical protein
VIRGGSFNNNDTNNLRAVYRNNNTPTNRNNNIGFRCRSTPSRGRMAFPGQGQSAAARLASSRRPRRSASRGPAPLILAALRAGAGRTTPDLAAGQ